MTMIAQCARAMQNSPAWPAVFDAIVDGEDLDVLFRVMASVDKALDAALESEEERQSQPPESN